MASLDTIKLMKPTGINEHIHPSFIDLDSSKVKRVPYTGPSVNNEDPKHVARRTQHTVSVNRGNDIPTEIDLSKGQQEPMFLDCYMELGQEAMDTEEEAFFDTFSGLEGTDIHEGQDKDGCFYFDMIESMPVKQWIGKAFHLMVDYDYVNEYMVP
jgi:hypothetical protein